MSDPRPAEAWEKSAPGPYARLLDTDHEVTIWAMSDGRRLVVCNGSEHVVYGHAAAHRLAHELAGG